MHPDDDARRRRRGALLGLAAAASFGLSAPLAKALLGAIEPLLLAGLLYLGAAAGLTSWRWLRPPSAEAPLSRADAPWLLGIIALGGIVAPAALLFGLSRVSAGAGSLLLNLEAPFTIGIAVLFFREHLGRRVALAALSILSGALVLRLAPGGFQADTLGVLLIAAACLCWAVDNNFTQRLSLKDPVALVRIKTLAAGTCNVVLGLALARAPLPGPGPTLAALLLGSVSYGASVVLDAYALRAIGAAREAAYFATAPFIGVLASWLVLREAPAGGDLAAMALMLAGVALLLGERHSHLHTHHEIEHDHLHEHDDHHAHEHGPDDPPGEPHRHPHRHAALRHEHPHLPDQHHRHEH